MHPLSRFSRFHLVGRRVFSTSLAAIALTALVWSGAADPAHSKTTVSATYAQVEKQRLSVFVRAAGAPKKSFLLVEAKASGKTLRFRGALTKKKTRSLSLRLPRGASSVKVQVRVVVRKKGKFKTLVKGRWRKVKLSRSGRSAKLAKIKNSQITGVLAPTADTPGSISVKGSSASQLASGRVISMGVSDSFPYGMLARVSSVNSTASGKTATLTQASIADIVPAGQMDLSITPEPVASVSAAKKSDESVKALQCDTSRSATAKASAELSAGFKISAGWSGGSAFPPKVPKLSATATGSVNARLSGSLSLNGEAKCTLTPQTLFPTPQRLAVFTVQVGPVPVPVVIEGQVTLTGSASANGSLSTSVSASASASAGVTYSQGRFTPTKTFTRSFNYQPPTVNGSGEAGVALSPSVSVLLAGAAGPEVDVSGGLKLTGNLVARPGEPWWKLTAPVSLGAKFKFDLWQLHAASPRYTLWSEEPVLAQAATTGPPGSQIVDQGPSPEPLPPGVRTRLTWDSNTDVDLHSWNQYGDHAYFDDMFAIAGGYLDEDVIPGYGPETFFEDDPSYGNEFTFGVCQYSGYNSNVTVDVRDPNGQTRRYTVLLRGKKAAALLTTSPVGITPYVDLDGDWCDSSGTDPTQLGQVSTGYF